MFRQVSWLEHRRGVFITVARPRGIHTRFPILPSSGHPDTLLCKDQRLRTRHTNTRVKRLSNENLNQLNLYFVLCTLCFVVDIEYKN